MRRLWPALVASLLLGGPPAALATGGDEPGEMQEALASAPARVLAQQALVLLDVTGDAEEAAERVDAALESQDTADVDLALLAEADEVLDAGSAEDAVALLNRALGGGPVPAGEHAEDEELSGVADEALHKAGRAYEPNETSQELFALIAGLALLALATLLLVRRAAADPVLLRARGGGFDSGPEP